MHGLDRELAAGVGVKLLVHGVVREIHGRHLRAVRILRRRRRLHPLLSHLALHEVLVRHGRRRGVGEALLLLEAELGLLRWRLRARLDGALAVPLRAGQRTHGEAARAVHLGVCDGARVDEARGIVHSVLGRLEVHDGALLPRMAEKGGERERTVA